MKKKLFAVTAAIIMLAMVFMLTECGCAFNAKGSGMQNTETGETNTSETNESDPAAAGRTGSESTEEKNTEENSETETAESSELFTSRDLSQTADLSEAIYITVSDGETASISEAGVYVLKGSAENAMVVIEAGDEDKVQIVLDGVSITNTHQPCILVENADKVFITSADGSENSLTVSGKFTVDEDAAIFSRDDLVLNGLGTVTISSTNDGVRSNDDLKLTGGTWNVTASGSAIKAHDSICACGGSYTLSAANDGIHAEDNDDDTIGSIVIEGGSFNIQAGDDGIHATTTIAVSGGDLAITAAEGIEATQVVINDGSISIKASDDAINAGRKSDSLNVKIEINGGEITIAMGAGDTDAIDSNGDLAITGGTIDITAQSPFDYDGSCSYTGGTIIVNGTQVNTIPNQMMGGGMMGGGPMGGGQMRGGPMGGGQMDGGPMGGGPMGGGPMDGGPMGGGPMGGGQHGGSGRRP